MLYTVYVSNHFGYNRPVRQTKDKGLAVSEADAWARTIGAKIGEIPKRPWLRFGANRFRWRTPNGVIWVWIAVSDVEEA